MKFTIRKGLDLVLPGVPRQAVEAGRPAASVAILGHDYPGVRPDYRVAQGDRVRTGQALFADRKRPEIVFTAPATGVITAIRHGERRMLDALVIDIQEDEPETFEGAGNALTSASVRELLLASGMWSAFRTRPFGRIPDPQQVPEAIFVTATDTNPLAGDPAVIVAPQRSELGKGLEALQQLCDGPVFVCQPPGAEFAAGNGRVRTAVFAGRHPAGLAGTHIHYLMPVSAQRTVWQIGVQEVIAIGRLLETGQLSVERVVALSGPGVAAPGLIRTRIGAHLGDLIPEESGRGERQLISGSVLAGRRSAYLGRHHTQVTVLNGAASGASDSFWARIFSRLPAAPPGPLIALEALDRAMPLDIPAAALMRALSVGDIEAAARLGCLELLEEDVALLSYLCAGRTDYGALLRRALDELEGGA